VRHVRLGSPRTSNLPYKLESTLQTPDQGLNRFEFEPNDLTPITWIPCGRRFRVALLSLVVGPRPLTGAQHLRLQAIRERFCCLRCNVGKGTGLGTLPGYRIN
jgi:hypothetical protein